jgi:transposase
MTPGEILKELKCAINTVKYWIKTFKDIGDVEKVPKTERPRKITENQDEAILNLVEQDREAVVKDIHSKIKKRKIDISLNTIRKKMIKAGLEFGPLLVKFLLTDKYIQS